MTHVKRALCALPMLLAVCVPFAASADTFECRIPSGGLRGVPHQYTISYDGSSADLTFRFAGRYVATTLPVANQGGVSRMAFTLGGAGGGNPSTNRVDVSLEHHTANGGFSARIVRANTGETEFGSGTCLAARASR